MTIRRGEGRRRSPLGATLSTGTAVAALLRPWVGMVRIPMNIANITVWNPSTRPSVAETATRTDSLGLS